ncbi:hypothetical protein MYX76_17595 [Desulfobacterota bacterium AH_259_B03_O07]|nr:hypothetical protein [Desulfobacterota bacterium AH_259_B03_O07]
MTETTFEKQVLKMLSHMEEGINAMKQEIDLIKERVVDDSILSDDDREDLHEALKEKKEGKLLTKDRVFG